MNCVKKGPPLQAGRVALLCETSGFAVLFYRLRGLTQKRLGLYIILGYSS